MTISGLNPSLVTPGLVPINTAGQLTGAQLNGTGALPTTNNAFDGAVSLQKPSLFSRMSSAMKAAVSELKGSSTPQYNVQSPVAAATSESLALAPKPSDVKKSAKPKAAKTKPNVAKNKPKATQTKPSAVKAKAKSDTSVSVDSKTQPAVSGAAPAGIAPIDAAPGSNITQLPNATVYSFADPNNAALAGLQGLDPAMQAQLGLLPNYGNPYFGAGVPMQSGPTSQQNMTNQQSLDLANGMNGAMGAFGTMGAPVIGMPIMQNTNLSAEVKAAQEQAAEEAKSSVNNQSPPPAPGQPHSTLSVKPEGQSVVNRNKFSGEQAYDPLFGGVYPGFSGLGAAGVATPYAPYGASMSGVGLDGQTAKSGGVLGWLSRLVR